jgi:hypothetical protein
MRIIVLAIAVTILGGMPFAAQDNKQNRNKNRPLAVSEKKESPFACDVWALDPVARKRHFDELGPMLRGLKTAVRELPNGYEFQFPPDFKTFQLVAEWVAGERLCCPFFDIDMRAEREGGPLWLRLTGRDGTKQFIQADAPGWIQQ